jgi:preprotein translocase subunit SecD
VGDRHFRREPAAVSARQLMAFVLLLVGCERSGIQLEYEMPKSAPPGPTQEAVRRRLKKLIGRADVTGQGTQVIVRISGGRSVEQVKRVLAQPAFLEVSLYRDDLDVGLPPHTEFGSTEELSRAVSLLKLPSGCRVAATESSHGRYKAICIASEPVITEDNIADASASGEKVMIRLDADAAVRFGDFTAANVGRRLAFVLDGTVLQAPVIQDPIRGGRAMLIIKAPPGSGATDAQYAEALASSLTTGALPEMKLVSETRYGPGTGS